MAGVRTSGVSAYLLTLWITMLALAQATDMLTTKVDLEHGGVEANALAQGLLGTGGIGMLWLVKLALVAALAVGAVLAFRLYRIHGGRCWWLASELVWRAVQACVVGLTLVSVSNLMVLTALLHG